MVNFSIKTLLGQLSMLTTIAALVPQIYKVYKTRSAGDISLGMCFLFSLSAVFWVGYGFLIPSTELVLTNFVMLIFNLVLFYLRIKYGPKSD